MPLVKVNDANLYYEDHGRGPALLFMHGWGTSGRVWGAQQVEFAGRWRVVTVDWRGCGRSECTSAANDLEGAIADIEALIAALDLDRPVLIGSSIAAVFSVETALKSPHLPSGVVTVDGPGFWPSQGMDLAPLLDGLRADRARTVSDWVAGWFAPGVSRPLVDWTIRQILDCSPFIDGHLPIFTTYDPRPRLPDLKVPIAFLHGERDPQIPPSVSSECARITPRATARIIPASGHVPHQEHPAAFNEALRQALHDLRDSAGA
jgi:pimeloyl-ACP methyl ester carboxylesterase